MADLPQEPFGEIAEVQLLQLFLEVNQDVDTQFQVWVSITFAVMVASFVAGARLSMLGRLVITAMYLCASAVLFLRYQNAVDLILYVAQLYPLYGVESPTFGSLRTLGLRTTLIIFGSALAAAAVLFPRLGYRKLPTEA